MLALALAASLAATPPDNYPSSYFLDPAPVVQLDCDTGKGTAFYIGDGRFLTAKHVVLDGLGRNAGCKIGKVPTKLLEYGKGQLDYAMIEAPVYPERRVIISCAGFREGDSYYATGYALGEPWPVTQRLIGTTYQNHARYELWNKTTTTRGSTIEGQSGGPVSDNDGLVVGIVSHGALAGVTEADPLALKDTPICNRSSN